MTQNRITIVHDSFGKPSGLRKEWGFAALIEFNGQRLLFDTGNSARTLAENTAAMEVDLRHLDFAVISHRHGDHTSGLNHLLQVHPEIAIYAPAETYGVFGSSLPGSFYPRCHVLPAHMQYYDGKPPETIPHGSPWPDAKFVWIKQMTEVSPGIWLIPVISVMPGTRELPEISLGIRTRRGLVVVAGCSHPGIENILAASRQIEERVFCIFGGLHLVLTQEQEIRRIAKALRDEWCVERIAPGHCTGEPAFAALSEVFGERYVFAGLGDSIELPQREAKIVYLQLNRTLQPRDRMLVHLRTEAYQVYAQHMYPPVGDAYTACNKLSYELNNCRIDAARYQGAVSYAQK